MRRLIAFANFALLLSVLVTTAACGSSYSSGPAIAPASSSSSSKSRSDSAAPASSSGSGPAASGSAQGQVVPTPAPSLDQSPLTAGQVDDNLGFGEYITYLQNYVGPTVHPVDVSRRVYVHVVDGDQHPIAGARVQLFDGDRQVFDGRTVSDGRVLFFPNATGATQTTRFRGIVSRGQQLQATFEVEAGNGTPTVVLKGPASGSSDNTGPVGIDLVFLLDSTGSMGDEIDRIKATVGTIASRIEQLPGSSMPRLGLVTYRDRGDEYVTRQWDFTGDIGQFSANLAQVWAGGGGDTPESVNSGLRDAINLPNWADSGSGRHVRMIVLVGDAPPHLDYQDEPEYKDLLSQAVAQGIKIFPIGASGLDDQGEYIFRQCAEITQGQFVFLTYANGMSGAPGSATTDHVSNYSVQNLDNLVVNLVAGEVANQTGQAVGDNPPVLASVSDYAPPAPASRGSWVLGLAALAIGLVFSEWQAITALVTGIGMGFWVLLVVMTVVALRRRALRGAPDLERPAALTGGQAASVYELDITHPERQKVAVRRVRARQHLDGNHTGVWARGPVTQPEGQLTLPLGSLPAGISVSGSPQRN